MTYSNSALIQDEILFNISSVIDNGAAAGPSFLFSLGAMAEALVLHETIYFDPLDLISNAKGGGTTLDSILHDSAFVQRCLREKMLTPFPKESEVNEHLSSRHIDYSLANFMFDYYWSTASFTSHDSDTMRDQYLLTAYLIENMPDIFFSKDLIRPIIPGEMTGFYNDSAGLLLARGVPVETLRMLEAHNHRATGWLELAKNMGLNLYLVDAALPYQIGAIQSSNQKAKEIYKTMQSHFDSLALDDVGTTGFSRVYIPPLSQIVLERAKDSKGAIVEELFELRDRHRDFRHYMTDYERAWVNAKTRKDRFRLRNEFNNAWKQLIKKQEKPSTRIIYTLWDILKDPTKILERIGDKLADMGKEMYAIGQVRGMHDFWNELLRSPTSDRNQEILSKLFSEQVDDGVWLSAGKFENSLNEYITK